MFLFLSSSFKGNQSASGEEEQLEREIRSVEEEQRNRDPHCGLLPAERPR
jgi:hypothetical protein